MNRRDRCAQGKNAATCKQAAAYPTAHSPDLRNLAATLYHLLDVPANTVVHDQTSRPHPLVLGQKSDGLLG